MTNDLQDKVKIRFKFRSGEEFEAEGNPDFIEKQRADFLQLIAKDGTRIRRCAPDEQFSSDGQTTVFADSAQTVSPSVAPTFPASDTAEPAFFRRKSASYLPSGDRPVLPSAPQMSLGISAAENAHLHHRLFNEQEIRLWEQVTRTDDKMVFLRRKSRQLSPDTAALVLIAAAKVLLQAADGYSALLLSKSLKKSGYGGERLDRVLGGELKKGTVCSEGTKRSRLYLLSDEGFARAYVLATKLADEWKG